MPRVKMGKKVVKLPYTKKMLAMLKKRKKKGASYGDQYTSQSGGHGEGSESGN